MSEKSKDEIIAEKDEIIANLVGQQREKDAIIEHSMDRESEIADRYEHRIVKMEERLQKREDAIHELQYKSEMMIQKMQQMLYESAGHREDRLISVLERCVDTFGLSFTGTQKPPILSFNVPEWLKPILDQWGKTLFDFLIHEFGSRMKRDSGMVDFAPPMCGKRPEPVSQFREINPEEVEKLQMLQKIMEEGYSRWVIEETPPALFLAQLGKEVVDLIFFYFIDPQTMISPDDYNKVLTALNSPLVSDTGKAWCKSVFEQILKGML